MRVAFLGIHRHEFFCLALLLILTGADYLTRYNFAPS